MTKQPMAEQLVRGLRFERRLAHPPERVWRAITDSAELTAWLAREAQMDVREGGRVMLRWSETEVARGTVVRIEPPHLLEYTWQEDGDPSLVRFELSPTADGTLLVLTHLQIDALAGFGAAWHAHLDVLEGILDGREIAWQERWDTLKPRYDGVIRSTP